MGGLGSGRQGSSAPTVESFRKIDLAALERINLVNAGDQQAIGSTLVELRRDGLLIYYFHPERTEEFVPFLYTATQFGGRRRWLACPRCSRRRRVLYRAQRFRCRECCGLVYQSTRETWNQRAISQADKLAMRMAGGRRELFDGDEFPKKPKRMRWATYRRIEERFYQLKDLWAAGLIKRLGIGL
jgi:hypothetical protein